MQLSLLTALLISFSLFFLLDPVQATIDDTRRIYIVHVNPKGGDLKEYHYQLLTDLLGSQEAAKASLVYSYDQAFLGFAAWMTSAEAERIQQSPGVLKAFPDSLMKVQTTRSWDYLGLPYNRDNELLSYTNYGEDSIIGIIDTGIWPESRALSDAGLGPIPSRWNGTCVSGKNFDARVNCNKKLIGCTWFNQGFPDRNFSNLEYESCRDSDGHGTHVATTAAGSLVENVSDSYLDMLAFGNMRGGAMQARLAIYKVCWLLANQLDSECRSSNSDILQAFSKATSDGVDVISVSISPDYISFEKIEPFFVGSFIAVSKGIPVVCGAGNFGPKAYTITNTMPWVITVAASSIDRSFPTTITLEGYQQAILGQSTYTEKEIKSVDLVLFTEEGSNSLCSGDAQNGKIVLSLQSSINAGPPNVTKDFSCAGVIYAGSSGYFSRLGYYTLPMVEVDPEIGFQILKYIHTSRSPRVSISPAKTLVNSQISTKIASFSSRGPNLYDPAILKPDIAAPGVNILAATNRGFQMFAGTSMSAPHVSGVVALLKSLHPDWSPAAIKSAIVTTAWVTYPSGEPIFAEGSPRKLADPFDYGGGIINPNAASDPGLVYDVDIGDYYKYLCNAGFNVSSLSIPPENYPVCQDQDSFSVLDINLPSITIPSLRDTVTVQRSVTNVGPYDISKYWVLVDEPQGITVEVFPTLLVYTAKGETLPFTVRVTTSHTVQTGYLFGSLTWTDGSHQVRIPLSVRTKLFDNYADDN